MQAIAEKSKLASNIGKAGTSGVSANSVIQEVIDPKTRHGNSVCTIGLSAFETKELMNAVTTTTDASQITLLGFDESETAFFPSCYETELVDVMSSSLNPFRIADLAREKAHLKHDEAVRRVKDYVASIVMTMCDTKRKHFALESMLGSLISELYIEKGENLLFDDIRDKCKQNSYLYSFAEKLEPFCTYGKYGKCFNHVSKPHIHGNLTNIVIKDGAGLPENVRKAIFLVLMMKTECAFTYTRNSNGSIVVINNPDSWFAHITDDHHAALDRFLNYRSYGVAVISCFRKNVVDNMPSACFKHYASQASSILCHAIDDSSKHYMSCLGVPNNAFEAIVNPLSGTIVNGADSNVTSFSKRLDGSGRELNG